jgi:hypothetical protein
MLRTSSASSALEVSGKDEPHPAQVMVRSRASVGASRARLARLDRQPA